METTVCDQEGTSHRISSCIDHMSNVGDLFMKLTNNGSTTISGLGMNAYVETSPEFLLARRSPIPEELLHQMRNSHAQFRMGMFPEISRVWVVVDSEVFMWNYETNRDLAYFDAVQGTILKIALVKLKPNVFPTQYNYGLAVGTTTEFSLYPIVVGNTGGDSSVAIDPTQFFKVILENTLVGDIISMDNGRIFFTGNERLYEFVYEHHRGWFRDGKKCRIINQSSSLLSTFIPFLGDNCSDIVQLAADSSRHLLFTLDKNSSIQVFDLGADGEQCQRIAIITQGRIVNQAQVLTQYSHDDSNFQNIVSISALGAYQSHQLNLVAVTVKGVRLYFSVLERSVRPQAQGQYLNGPIMTQADVRPRCLRIAHIRFSSGVAPSSLYGTGPQGVDIAQADESLTVMSVYGQQMVHAFSDLFYVTTARESKTDLKVFGNVWAMDHSQKYPFPDILVDKTVLPSVRPHPFYHVPFSNKGKLFVCSSEGIHEFEQVTPVDALREALMSSAGVDSRAVADLLTQYGQTELLVLALHLMVSDVPVNEKYKDRAASLFVSLKDSPRLITDTIGEWSTSEDSIIEWKNKIRSPLQASTPTNFVDERNASFKSPLSTSVISSPIIGGHGVHISCSHRHEALFSFFSRLVYSIWSYPLCVSKPDPDSVQPLVSADYLEFMSNYVRRFVAAIEKFHLVPQSDGNLTVNALARVKADVHAVEKQSLHQLRKIAQTSAETLSLWAIAIRLGLNDVSKCMEPANRAVLASRKFSQLVNEGDYVNGEIIKALIKFYLGDQAGTKELSEKLRTECPTLYSADDACVTNAMEQLRLAATQGVGPNRRRLILSAVDMFSQSILRVNLPEVCKELLNLDSCEYIVDLCLLRAKKEDPRQLAAVAYQHNVNVDDNDVHRAFEARNRAYRVLTDVLDDIEMRSKKPAPMLSASTLNRDELVAQIIASEDELAHGALFRWMLDRNRAKEVLESKSPFVESFLTHEVSAGGGQRYLDLLWQWYEKCRNFDKAAMLLARLSDNSNRDISLAQRYAYLSHAIMCAEASNDAKASALIEDLKDKVEVAQIQMRVKERLEAMEQTQRVRDLLRSLDGPIVSLNELLGHYAIPLKFYSLQLSIYHCANVYDGDTIADIWDNVIESAMEGDHRVGSRLRAQIKELFLLFSKTKYFPTEYILRRLLSKGSSGTANLIPATFFVTLIKDIDYQMSDFLRLLFAVYREDEQRWNQDERGLRYIVDVCISAVDSALHDPEYCKIIPVLANECESLLSALILDSRNICKSGVLSQYGPRLESLHNRLSTSR